MSTKSLSLLLICASCVLTAFFLRKRVRAVVYFPLLLLLLLPTMINETKGSLIVTPIALFVTFVVASAPRQRLKNLTLAVAVGTLFLAVFIPVYDHFMMPRWGYGIVDFFTMEGRAMDYLDRGGGDPAGYMDPDRNPGKLAAVRVMFSELRHDPALLFFGIGIGNGDDSALGEQFSGRYQTIYGRYYTTALAQVLVEWGLAGCSAGPAHVYWLCSGTRLSSHARTRA
jgi:hypothetical protein